MKKGVACHALVEKIADPQTMNKRVVCFQGVNFWQNLKYDFQKIWIGAFQFNFKSNLSTILKTPEIILL